MFGSAGPSKSQDSLDHQSSCAVETKHRACGSHDAPTTASLICVPDHRPYFYADLTPWAARAVLKQGGPKTRLSFRGRS